jgi:hypothetical protein
MENRMLQRASIFATSCAAVALLGAKASIAHAQELPSRKAGQWEVRTVTEKPIVAPPIVTQMCLDAATDRELLNFGLRASKDSCKRYELKREGKAWVIDAECKIGPISSASHITITGDFQSAVAVKIEGTTQGIAAAGAGPQQTLMTQTSRWIAAACAEGMVPGDILLGKGMKMNVKQLKGLQNILPQIQIR